MEMRAKPGLVVCLGAQKAATSSLHSLMAQHSQVAVTNIKETGFFFRDALYSKGLKWYLNEFFDRKDAKILFEADPNYMCFPICLDRLLECGKVSKVIVMLRNPAERLISSYMMMQRYELEMLSFEEAIETEQARIMRGEMERETFNYVERSMYAKQIEQVLKRFSREQVLFILFEDFVENQGKEFRKVQAWLGLDIEDCSAQKENTSYVVKSRLVNKLAKANGFSWLRKAGKKVFGETLVRNLKSFVEKRNRKAQSQLKPGVSQEMKGKLYKMFEKDIIQTEKLTGLNLSMWRKNG